MPLDTFICGSCMTSFNDIEQFILHKNDLCGKDSDPSTSSQGMEIDTSVAISSVATLAQITGDTELNMEVADEQGHIISSTSSLPGTESLLANTSEIFQGDNQQTVIIVQGNIPNLNLEGAGQLLAEMTQDPKLTLENFTGPVKKKKSKGPGRPRKIAEEKPKFDANEKKSPERSADGRLTCTRCKRSFNKERVFNAHKCIALSEYVDFTTKDVLSIDPDDNHMPQDDIADSGAMEMDDQDTEFKLPLNALYPAKKHEATKTEVFQATEKLEKENKANSGENGKDEGGGENSAASGGANNAGTESAAGIGSGVFGPVEVESSPDIEDVHINRETDHIHSLPVFLNETDKIDFEACLNVDLSGVDHMFRIHCIEQELNQNASQLSRFSSNQLALYSCNTCDKVFKSLSHMRFHVLTHTDLKPFKCIKCDYTSNARGNLYTHMRKHTGQYYQCDKCKFRTVNKSHLIEHEMTHARIKRQCELCKKHYNTIKSLMSHIRKYHDNQKGKDLLSTFMQGRDIRGSTVIHQCHVCNRKFKKKMDRDRHLFVHDIKDLPNTQHCDLCDYTASRPKYLEKHFQKHRCIYRCCKCGEMFLSSVRLVDHLTGVHIDSTDKKSETWEAMFEESINNSLYLPEPDQVIPQGEKDLINLPTELSETGLDQMQKLQNSGEDDLTNKLINAADAFINKLPTTSTGTSQGDESVKVEEIEQNKDDQVTANLDAEHIDESAAYMETSASENNDQTKTNATESTEVNETIIENEQEDNFDAGETENTETGDTERETADDSAALDTGLDNGESVLEETDMTEEELLGVKSKSLKGAELIQKLGYLQMTLQIFQKMRDTFGTEECEYCGRLFFSRVDYEPHVRTHTGDKPHVCQKCGFRAITRDNLKRHVEKDHDNITYPCRECPYVANSRTQLWNHSMKHKGLKGLECPECQEQVETLKELKNHAALMHPNSNREELEKLTSYKHKAQGKLGRRSYKCPHCDKVFFRANSELQKHMWIHEGIKPFKCPLCPHACRSKNNLQAHMLRHSKDKPFLCGDCGKAYKSRTALRWHVRSHADGKLFKCNKCPYEATQRSHLKRHMETHEVIKRYACSHCDFSANTLGYLKIHCTRFHKDVDTNILPAMGSAPVEISQPDRNVFKCLSCDYLFGNLSDLKRHLKTRHHVNVQEIQKVEGQGSEIQVVQFEDGNQQPQTMEIVTDTVTESQVTTDQNVDEKTASAVNILQQIIDMSQNGTFTQQVDGNSILQVNPETIIVQQDGSEMYVSSNNTTEIDGNQYVIQYVTPQEEVSDGINMVEVQGEEIEAEVLAELQTAEIVTS